MCMCLVWYNDFVDQRQEMQPMYVSSCGADGEQGIRSWIWNKECVLAVDCRVCDSRRKKRRRSGGGEEHRPYRWEETDQFSLYLIIFVPFFVHTTYGSSLHQMHRLLMSGE